VLRGAVSVAVLLAGAIGAAALARSTPAAGGTDACAVPVTAPIWVDYGEGPVKPDTRAILARPGVVVTTSGTAIPAYFRERGAATTYMVLHLPNVVGQPATPADPATMPAVADALYAKAAASTACATPWIALNELFGASLPTPWSPTNARYRGNVLALMQGLAAHGAHPVLFVNGNPSFAGDAAAWWQQVGQAGSIAYEAYFDARNISGLGSLLGNRRARLGMRRALASFVAAGIPSARLGLVLGFHSGLIAGAGGRQGLQPREAWLRVVKWETLAARQVAADMHLGSVWVWGWGTFGAGSVDADKPAAACVSLWARNQTLCDAPTVGGAAFNASLTEGQIVLPPGVACNLYHSRRILSADITRLAAFTGDRGSALDTLFARIVFRSRVQVGNDQVLAVEQQSIDRDFGGDRNAYLAALAQAHATVGIAQNVIRDELKRRAIPALLAAAGNDQAPFDWQANAMTTEARTMICLRDELPGGGDIRIDDNRYVPIVPLLARLPFLFDDTTPPAAPDAAAYAAGKAVQLTWRAPIDSDVSGFDVFRSPTPGGPYTKLNARLVILDGFADTTAPLGLPSYYVVQAVDTSGNESVPSPELTVTPG
jgi:hypothetical protein